MSETALELTSTAEKKKRKAPSTRLTSELSHKIARAAKSLLELQAEKGFDNIEQYPDHAAKLRDAEAMLRAALIESGYGPK